MVESAFVQISREDMLRKVEPLLREGYFIKEEDGKIDCIRRPAWETPWVHIKHGNNDCHYLHKILFEYVLGKKLVPIVCHECWKVVTTPRTVKELMVILEVLKDIDMPSKCGMEIFRKNTKNRYGAYLYNESFEEGKVCYKMMRKRIDSHSELGKDIKVVLKRGCTEYEQIIGPSNEWKIPEQQREMEAIAESVFAVRARTDMEKMQPYHLITHVMREWLMAAWQIGDQSYLEFTGGEEMYKPVVTYHDGGNLNG